jgi:hypothetical protein
MYFKYFDARLYDVRAFMQISLSNLHMGYSILSQFAYIALQSSWINVDQMDEKNK